MDPILYTGLQSDATATAVIDTLITDHSATCLVIAGYSPNVDCCPILKINRIENLIRKSIFIVSTSATNKNKPWIIKGLCDVIKNRNTLYKLMKQFPRDIGLTEKFRISKINNNQMG